MKKLWFRRKRYGYGWTPSTIEGWLVIGIYAVLMIIVVAHAAQTVQSGEHTLIQLILPVIILTAIMLVITYIKGEKPRWQWGNKTPEDKA